MILKLPDPARPIHEQDDDVLLAMCLWGEARGEMPAARLAVGNVVHNRLQRDLRCYGRTWRTVILHPYAFSCFLPADPNRAKLLRPLLYGSGALWSECIVVARMLIAGAGEDNTLGATHYYDASLDVHPPAWASSPQMKPTVTIGRLRFFREEIGVPDA